MEPCMWVSVERKSKIEHLKRISPRLSKSSNMRTLDIHARKIKTCHTVHGTAQFVHQAHKSPIAHTAHRTAPPSSLPSQQHCLRTICPSRAAAVALSAHMHCHTTPSLRHRLHAGAHPTDDRTAARLAGAHRCDRHAACPSRTPTAATSSRSPRPLRLTAAL